ncbi:MAG: GNAT family N-acetyltransferase [Saprospiraceae bacterium]|nr:GNAT family N-acetyltransferase [Saprospiraceae bacterium]
MVNQLDKIFKPQSIAVIGASTRENTVGNSLFKNLIDSGFKGGLYPVNAKSKEVLGIPAYENIAAVPGPIDLAVIIVPAKLVPGVVEECGKAGVGGLLIISAGFQEAGEEGKAMVKQILATSRKYGMRIVGPNCLGIINPKLGMNATFANQMALPGNIAFISQSGALCSSILDWAAEQNVGFSHFVSIGSMIDIGFAELIDYFGMNQETACILVYMESLTNARQFMSAARAFARSKPIIILKSGSSQDGTKAAMSHTGTLAGNDAAFEAAFRRAGCVRVERIAQLFHCAQALSTQPRPAGNRLAIVTNAGGPGVLATDFLTTRGGQLAQLSEETIAKLNEALPAHWSHGNPVDVLGDASPVEYRKAVEACLADPGVDGVLTILTTQTVTDPAGTAEALVAAGGHTRKPLLASWMGEKDVRQAREILELGKIPNYRYPESGVDVFLQMWQYTRNLQSLYETPRDAPLRFEPKRDAAWHIIRSALAEGRHYLLEHEAKALLKCYALPVGGNFVAKNAKEAGKYAEEAGFPVVMKIVSPDALHKTDVGGVKLNITTKAAAEKAYEAIIESVKKHKPEAHIIGVLVEKMQKKRYELLFGAKRDPIFGPLIVVGQGGVAVEIINDTSFALPPLNLTLATRTIERTRIYKQLKGFRGLSSVDLEDLAFSLQKFSYILTDFPEVREIDINPYLVDETGGVVVDARILLDDYQPRSKQHPYQHLVISPYPEKYIKKIELKDGRKALLRPIRPEDEPMEAEMFKNLSDQSLYFRFFGFKPKVNHDFLSRLTQIDYDREIALIVDIEEGETRHMAGVAHIIADAWGETAEFAILIADPYQNKGIGNIMMDYVLEIARDRGIKRIYASVLCNNSHMIRMFKDRGFVIKPGDESTFFSTELDLENALPFLAELPFEPK